jgi:hypothetical protein
MRGPFRAGAALGLALLAAPAARAEPVPERLCPDTFEMRILRPSIVRAEARVTCAVERDPRLAQRAVAEARQAVSQAMARAMADTRGKAVEDREEHAFSWTTEPVHVTEGIASLLTTVREAVGLSSPTVSPRALTWDLERGISVTLPDLLRDARPGSPALTALRDAVRGALRAEAGGDPGLVDGIKADLGSLRHWTLAPGAEPGKAGGITFHYGSSGPSGRPLTAFVPTDVLAPHLAPARRDLFGPPAR